MPKLLFVCSGPARLALMAEVFARDVADSQIEIASASLDTPREADPHTLLVLQEMGAPVRDAERPEYGEVRPQEYDAIVTLTPELVRNCPLLLPAHPCHVHWSLSDPAQEPPARRLEAFRRTAERVRQLVSDFFAQGYFEAMRLQTNYAGLMLESLAEGIVAHDMDRRIVYMNRAAEEITGLERRSVLGRDCHDVFDKGLCGEYCGFPEDCEVRPEDRSYPLEVSGLGGKTHKLEVTRRIIRLPSGEPRGAMASFRDLTNEHALRRQLGHAETFAGIVGRHPKMLEVFDLIRNVADSAVPVLIQGESGTGKELVANAVHRQSYRRNRLFVPVNCGALPEGLLESELFGHVRGAFTGAVRDKKGRFELADGGTIFLDEIGDISANMQVKLLRVLQEGTFEPVGGTRTITVDVRIVSATNKDLSREIAYGRFREDLYYRLCVLPILLPPLRERGDDVELLIDFILRRAAAEAGREEVVLSPSARHALMRYPWPGNIRELQNAVQYAMVRCQGLVIELRHLPPAVVGNPQENGAQKPAGVATQPAPAARWRKLDLPAVRAALQETGGNKKRAAEVLGVSRATLYRFLAENPLA